MRKVTPEIQKQMEESGIPIIKISLEDLVAAQAVTDPEEVKKINQRLKQNK
jgi:tripartite-type tricarboxylate transporter receptor subunit TctC